MKREVCYGTIPIHNKRVFLVFHKKGHYWGLPKGHAEPGEHPEETAQRELKEETSLEWKRKITHQAFQETYHFTRDGEAIEKRVEYYLVEVGELAQVTDEEILHGEWFPWKEAIQQVTFEANRKILQKAGALVKEIEEGQGYTPST